jgi:DNA-binding transcriptional LysR family regulator
MTLKQLEAFYWAAKLGTFSIAAERLHVTQSSLSKRVAELEVSVGHALFDRSVRRAKLTASGEILMEKARQMLELESEIHASLDHEQEARGACRLGVSELAATTWLPNLATRIGVDYPSITFEPHVGLSYEMERQVVRGELDLAMIGGTPTHQELSSQVIADLELTWIAAPSRLRRGTLLTAAHFSEHPVVTSTNLAVLKSIFDTWKTSNEITFPKTLSCNSLAATISLVIAGFGIGFQPKNYIMPLIKRGLLVPLRSTYALPRLLYTAIYRHDDDRAVVKSMLKLIHEEADYSAENLTWAEPI